MKQRAKRLFLSGNTFDFMTGFYTKFTTAKSNRDILIELLIAAAASMNDNGDCRLYIVNKDVADDTATWVTEIWENAAAHEASLKKEAAQQLIAKAMPLLTNRPEQHKLSPVGGKGF